MWLKVERKTISTIMFHSFQNDMEIFFLGVTPHPDAAFFLARTNVFFYSVAGTVNECKICPFCGAWCLQLFCGAWYLQLFKYQNAAAISKNPVPVYSDTFKLRLFSQLTVHRHCLGSLGIMGSRLIAHLNPSIRQCCDGLSSFRGSLN